MKFYTLWTAVLTILNIPIAWILLANDYSIYWVFVTRVIINFISAIIRPIYLKALVPEFSICSYFKNAVSRAVIVTVIIIMTYYIFEELIDTMNPVLVILTALIYSIFIISVFGLRKVDRIAVLNLLKLKS